MTRLPCVVGASVDDRSRGTRSTFLGDLRSPVFWGQITPIGNTQAAQTSSLRPTARRRLPQSALSPSLQRSSTKSDGQVYWLGPFGDSDDWVGIQCRVLDAGTTEYHMSWFRFTVAATSRCIGLGYLVATCLMSFTLGIGLMSVFDFQFPRRERTEIVQDIQAQPAVAESIEDKLAKEGDATAIEGLRANLSKNRSLREQLTGYLSQDGFSFDPSLPDVEEKRSVKISSDLDQSPPGQESIKLSNFQVQRLLELLAELAECEEESKPSQRSLEPSKPSSQQ